MQTTIAGVVGEELPRHPDWKITESNANACRWIPHDDAPATLRLTHTDDGWIVAAHVEHITVDAVGDEVLTRKLVVNEMDSVFDALDRLREWMTQPPQPHGE